MCPASLASVVCSGSVHTVARVGASPLFAAATAPRVRPSLDDGRSGCFHRSAVLETAAVCTSIFAFPNTWRLCVEPEELVLTAAAPCPVPMSNVRLRLQHVPAGARRRPLPTHRSGCDAPSRRGFVSASPTAGCVERLLVSSLSSCASSLEKRLARLFSSL